MTKKSEYDNFEHVVTQLLKVPHSEIKAKLEEEKKTRERKKKEKAK